MADISNFINTIQEMSLQRPLFIGIDGRSGSGKSTLAKEIADNLSDVKIIYLDPFNLYLGMDSKRIVVSEVFEPLSKTKSQTIYIIEGIFSLSLEFRKYYDVTIWVECPAQEGFQRGLARDISFNGIDNSKKWKSYWMPKEAEYIQKENPAEFADLVINCS